MMKESMSMPMPHHQTKARGPSGTRDLCQGSKTPWSQGQTLQQETAFRKDSDEKDVILKNSHHQHQDARRTF